MAGLGGSMMQAPVLEGVAETAAGVRLGGFYCKTAEIASRLSVLTKKMNGIEKIAQCEFEGYLFLLASMTEVAYTTPVQIAYYRQEPHKFFQDLPRFLSSLRAGSIEDISVSGSLGVVSLSVLYRPIEPRD